MARNPKLSLVFGMLCALATGPAGAQPATPAFDGVEAAWEEGPEGAFRPMAGGGPGATVYVDAALGLDTNDGGSDAPVATIARALELVGAGDTVVVRAGVYSEQVIVPDLSPLPTRASPLSLLADPPDGASVVLDGTGVIGAIEGNLDQPAGLSLYRDGTVIVRGFLIRNFAGYGMAVQQSSDSLVSSCAFAGNGTEAPDSVDLVLLSSRDVRVWDNLFGSATERALDDRSTDSWIEGNTFSGHTSSAVKIGPFPAGHGCRLQGNTFQDNPSSQGVVYVHDAKGVIIERNLVLGGNLQGIRLDGVQHSAAWLNTVGGFPTGIELRSLIGCRIEGNVLLDNVQGIEWLTQYLPETVVDGNLFWNNTVDVEGGTPGPADVTDDPLFVDPTGGDYTPGAGGPAVDTGPVDLPVPEQAGSRVDRGAVERGAGQRPQTFQAAAAAADTSPAVRWLLGSASDAQVAYRVQLDRTPGFDSADLLDSNWQDGAAARWVVPRAFALETGLWYVRVKVQADGGQQSPWSDPHVAFEVFEAPTCAAQSGTVCGSIDGCDGSWLEALDSRRCCLGSCTACADADGDGAQDGTCGGTDCDDANAAVHPGAEEVCDNGLDDDCDQLTDGGDDDCGCVDHDRDGYGINCEAGPDCDDSIASIYPGADELCDYLDDDCDGQTDEGFDLTRDPDNCGECAWACRANEVCDLGGCASACGGGRTDCDRACIDTSSDLANCGACGQACELPHAGESCSGGECLLTACEIGWVDLNAQATDGCEYACSPSGAEICDNGVDEDCDGLTDEDCGGGGCGCGTTGRGPATAGLFLLGFLLFLGGRRAR